MKLQRSYTFPASEMTEKEAAWKELAATLIAHAQTWDGLYNWLEDLSDKYQSRACPETASTSIMWYKAFTWAMRDLPEEGDCHVVIAYMAELAVMDYKTFGFGAFMTAAERNAEQLAALARLTPALDALRSVLGMVGEEVAPAGAANDPATGTPVDTSKLH